MYKLIEISIDIVVIFDIINVRKIEHVLEKRSRTSF
jgi:hypothetical protein